MRRMVDNWFLINGAQATAKVISGRYETHEAFKKMSMVQQCCPELCCIESGSRNYVIEMSSPHLAEGEVYMINMINNTGERCQLCESTCLLELTMLACIE